MKYMHTGIDIVKVDRFKNVSGHFMQRVFTSAEQAHIQKKGRPETAAGLFAAKEAIAKALSTGIVFPLTHIEIRHTPQGKPYAILHGKAKSILKSKMNHKRKGRVFHLAISISHSATDAIAVAILTGV